MQAIILAAGSSTRCYPLTLTRPKALLKVANKPIMEHTLQALKVIVNEVIIVVNYKAEMIKQAFKNSCAGLKLTYFKQQGTRGTGDALLQVSKLIKQDFILLYSDDIYTCEDLKQLVKNKAGCLITKVSNPENYGVVQLENSYVKRIIEKPEQPPTKIVTTGAYKLPKSFTSYLKNLKPSKRNELELTDAINRFCKENKLKAVEVKSGWVPVSYPWQILNANEFLLERLKQERKGVVERGAVVKGKLLLSEGSIIKSGAYLEGNIAIGKNTIIGPNCYIRGSTSIGNNCKVGNAVEVKNSVIMDNSKLPHLSYVGDSVIGYNVNLGAGTLIANLRHDGANVKTMIKSKLVDTGRRKFGSVIADNVQMGINTMIYPGRKLWPNTTTLPGEVVKKDKTE